MAGPMLLHRGPFCSPEDSWQHPESFFIVTSLREVLLASKGGGPGMLLNTLNMHRTAPTPAGPPPESIPPQISIELRLKNPEQNTEKTHICHCGRQTGFDTHTQHLILSPLFLVMAVPSSKPHVVSDPSLCLFLSFP